MLAFADHASHSASFVYPTKKERFKKYTMLTRTPPLTHLIEARR